jgi:hypothetical protein
MEEQLAEKLARLECGKPGSASLASRREGLGPALQRQATRFLYSTSSLIERVCSSGGFDTLSDAEKLYYALTLFKMRSTTAGFINFSSTVSALITT